MFDPSPGSDLPLCCNTVVGYLSEIIWVGRKACIEKTIYGYQVPISCTVPPHCHYNPLRPSWLLGATLEIVLVADPRDWLRQATHLGVSPHATSNEDIYLLRDYHPTKERSTSYKPMLHLVCMQYPVYCSSTLNVYGSYGRLTKAFVRTTPLFFFFFGILRASRSSGGCSTERTRRSPGR